MIVRPDVEQQIQQFRFRAEELRTIAQDWIDKEAQGMLLRLACEYERMAAHMEHQTDHPNASLTAH